MPNPKPKYNIEKSTYMTGNPTLPTRIKPFKNLHFLLSLSDMNFVPSGDILVEDLATNVDPSMAGS